MNKTFKIAIDVNKPVEPSNSFRIYRGDNVTFNFTFNNGEEAFDTSSATTLRVFAKQVKANGVDKTETPLFAGDFTTISTASFASANTAGDAGNYLLAVMLLDAQDNVITAQGIYFDLIENGYAGIYQPSEDYRDEVLDALQQAQAAASNAQASATTALAQAGYSESYAYNALASKNEAAQSAADALTSQESATQSAADAETAKNNAVSAKNDAIAAAETAASYDGSQLSLGREHFGMFHINGTAVSAGGKYLPASFSICRLVCVTSAEWEQISSLFYFDGNNLGWGSNKTLGFGIAKGAMDGIRFGWRGTSGVSGGQCQIEVDASKFADGKYHAFVACASNNQMKLYLDGVLQGQANAELVEITAPQRNWTFFASAGKWGRIFNFNFDLSASDAPYTVADYTSGKPIPPALCDPAAEKHAMLALDDYVITVGSTRYIPDLSGNVADMTVTGDVKGDRDASIARLAALIGQANAASS